MKSILHETSPVAVIILQFLMVPDTVRPLLTGEVVAFIKFHSYVVRELSISEIAR